MKYVNQQGLWVERVWNLRGEGQSFTVCLSRPQKNPGVVERQRAMTCGRPSSHLRPSSSRWRERGRGFIKLLLYLSQKRVSKKGEKMKTKEKMEEERDTSLHCIPPETGDKRSQRRHSSSSAGVAMSVYWLSAVLSYEVLKGFYA